MRIFMLMVLAIVLTACSSPSKTMQDCKKANWAGRGDLAGFEGQPKDAAWKAGNAICAEVGVSGDRSDFFEGWERGNTRYCEPRHALIQGRLGREYKGVCSGPQAANWLRAYDHGKLIADVDRDIDRIEIDLRKTQAAARDAAGVQREANLQQLRQTALLRRESLESQAIAQGWGLGR
ncbi:MAG: hypothetical protein RL341_448 [Pseudomonadota bacterium]|jgi:hypothetical protein